MATVPQTLVTAEQFYQLPEEEGREFELLDGEVIEMPSPTYKHNRIVTAATVLLHAAVSGRGAVVGNTDFSDGRYTTLRPDLVVLLGDKPSIVDPEKLPVTVPPDIVVEVISPSESAIRIERRKDAYLHFGVCEVWMIYPENRHVYIHTEVGIRRLRPGDTVDTPLLPGWSVAVDQLFEP
jgi:Uma2 family endonuclease